jgi:crotonobetainyl-CoA:carnitine CoA-transferase CaiB-like acyl-CoA transferase
MMFAPIHNYETMLSDPGVLEQGVLATAQHPVRGETKQIAPPWILDETPATVRLAAPLLGEHTDAVLGEAGYDAAKIAALRAAGVVR